VVVDPAHECFEGTYLYDGENLSVIVEPSNWLPPEAGSTVWIRDDANPTVLHAAYLSEARDDGDGQSPQFHLQVKTQASIDLLKLGEVTEAGSALVVEGRYEEVRHEGELRLLLLIDSREWTA